MPRKLKTILNRYREDKTTHVSFHIPPEGLIDEDQCCAVSNELYELSTSGWEKREATKLLYRELPQKTGLYLFAWRPYFKFIKNDKTQYESLRMILYVGKAGGNNSSNLKKRYKDEYSKLIKNNPSVHWTCDSIQCRKERLDQILNLWCLEYWFLVLSDDSDILRLEKKLIKIFNPPGNFVHKKGARFGKPEKAF